MSEAKAFYEFLVPTVSNEGRPFRTRHHRVFDDFVKKVAGGLTVYRKSLKGVWVGTDGAEYTDQTIPVRVMCSRGEAERIADFLAKHYKQLAVMYYCVSREVVVKNYAAVAAKGGTRD